MVKRSETYIYFIKQSFSYLIETFLKHQDITATGAETYSNGGRTLLAMWGAPCAPPPELFQAVTHEPLAHP